MPKLSKEERAELEAKLAADDADDPDDDYEVEIGDGDKFARVRYSKAKSWLQTTFGIDLDDTSQDEPEPDEKAGKKAPAADNVKAFRAGRRIS